MIFYSSGSSPVAHVLQFDPGDLLLEGLKQFISESGISDGVVVSGIGTLSECTMHMVTTTGFPPVEVFPNWDDSALELTSMQGVIADGQPHIHMNVSTKDAAVGGHLEPGCRVLYLAEVVVFEFVGLALKRLPNDKDILKLVPVPRGQG
jgi:predicted DNA-binding protein with PD1-like motif